MDFGHPLGQSRAQCSVQDLEAVGIDEVFEGNLQGVSQQPHVVDGDVSLSALDLADIRSRQPCIKREGFLRDVAQATSQAQVGRKNHSCGQLFLVLLHAAERGESVLYRLQAMSDNVSTISDNKSLMGR